MSGWRLFTGITGFLGQYLLCGALRRREPVAVLVRNRKTASAADRVNHLISCWEQRLGTPLQRPVVLEGDLRTNGLRVSNPSADWFRHNVTSVVHSAASVRFQESRSGEPMKSNVEGTRFLLDFCRDSNVNDFHYVSTAYTCGRIERSNSVIEELHALGGAFGNIYEQSKCIAEHLVVQSPGRFSRTIYRPSVIIGESTTGRAPSFNAIYTPLRLAWMMLRESPALVRSANDLLEPIGVQGTELRNLVPVDWVSETIGSIVRQPSHHGRIYHLTNPVPTEGREIISAMVDALSAEMPVAIESKRIEGATGRVSLTEFREHMQAYRSYFVSDPNFDNSRFRSVGDCPPCPAVNQESLTRAFTYAVRNQFVNETDAKGPFPALEPRRSLDTLLSNQEASFVSSTPIGRKLSRSHQRRSIRLSEIQRANGSLDSIRLTVAGSDGGCWQIAFGPNDIHCDLPEGDHDGVIQVYCTAFSFREWLERSFSFEEGLRAGAFVITGEKIEQAQISRLMMGLRSRFDANDEQASKRVQKELNSEQLEVPQEVEFIPAGSASC